MRIFMAGIGVLAAGATFATAQQGWEAGWRAPPDEGGMRRWEVAAPQATGTAEPGGKGAVVAEFPQGAILRNQGCVEAAGALWCKVALKRRGAHAYIAAEDLRAAIGPDGRAATGPDTSRTRARKGNYDESTTLPCAQEQGEALGTCKAGVARSGSGDSTVAVTFPNGFRRLLFFEFGDFVRASSTMSGVGTDIDWSLAEGRYQIRVDDQRFILKRAFVLGTPQ